MTPSPSSSTPSPDPMRVVYRLRYQWPSHHPGEPGDPVTGYGGDVGGELLYDDDGNLEWGAIVTRYYWNKRTLRHKMEAILRTEARSDDVVEWHPGRIISVERSLVAFVPADEWSAALLAGVENEPEYAMEATP